MNMSSVQMPRPVFWSGVRLAVKLTPHGPRVRRVGWRRRDHPLRRRSTSPARLITSCSGCPDSIRVMSGSGPFGPIFSGVWQSLQPPMVTRYWPRAIRAGSVCADEACACGSEQAAAVSAAIESRTTHHHCIRHLLHHDLSSKAR